MWRSSALMRSSICSEEILGVGVFQVGRLESGMKVAGGIVVAGDSVKGSEVEAWASLGPMPLVEGEPVPLAVEGFSSAGGRLSKRKAETRRLSIGPDETWSVSATSSSMFSRLPRA